LYVIVVIVARESEPLAAPSIAIALFAHAFAPRFTSRVAFAEIAPARAIARGVCATRWRVVVARAPFARAAVGRAVNVRIANALIVVCAAFEIERAIAGVDEGVFVVGFARGRRSDASLCRASVGGGAPTLSRRARDVVVVRFNGYSVCSYACTRALFFFGHTGQSLSVVCCLCKYPESTSLGISPNVRFCG
jgi:hypothetical protein